MNSLRLLENERLVWVRCHGIPIHAWNNEFFAALARKFGTFLGVDENTRKKKSMDVARILIRTKCYDVFNMVVFANNNGSMFHINVLEEWCGPMHWEGLSSAYVLDKSEDISSSEYDSDEEAEHPLFQYEDFRDEGHVEEDDEVIVEKLLEMEKLNNSEGRNVVMKTVVSTNACEGNIEKNFGGGYVGTEVENVGRNDEGESGDARKMEELKEQEIQQAILTTLDDLNLSLPLHRNNPSKGPNGINATSLVEVEDCNSGVQIGENANVDNGVVNGPTVLSEKVKDFGGVQDGLTISNSSGPLMRKKMKNSKRRDKSSSSSDGSENEVNQGVLVGIINDEARNLIPSISLSNGTKGESNLHVVTRKPPGSDLSLSFSCDMNGAAIGDVSVGDSGIQICNDRFWVDHEVSLANKVWSFAKESLGVTGKVGNEEYAGRIRSLEVRDQIAKARKGKKDGSQ